MNECVQCRGCEAACPSSVQFGHLMERHRAALARSRRAPMSRVRRVVEWIALPARAPVPLAVARGHVGGVGAPAGASPAAPVRIAPARRPVRCATPLDVPRGGAPTRGASPGCVMDAWLRDTHRSTVRVMRATGADVALPGPRAATVAARCTCTPAVQHEARRLARRVIASMPGDAPIVVNSAGCGAVMKDYGRMLGTAEAAAFSARVRDFSEWVVEQGAPPLRATGTTVVVQDPCHLRHVQRAHARCVPCSLARTRSCETDDDGLCCGAGGAYAVLQPELATGIRDRKATRCGARRRSATPIVVSANPGCMMHLRQAGLDVRHPADLLAAALPEERSPVADERYESIIERLADDRRRAPRSRLRPAARPRRRSRQRSGQGREQGREAARTGPPRDRQGHRSPRRPAATTDVTASGIVEAADQRVQPRGTSGDRSGGRGERDRVRHGRRSRPCSSGTAAIWPLVMMSAKSWFEARRAPRPDGSVCMRSTRSPSTKRSEW